MESEMHHNTNIHQILIHSYALQLFFFLIGLYLDFIFNIKIWNNSIMVFSGFSLLFIGTLLIVWAQSASRNLQKENLTPETFHNGPYHYTRTPTHWGIFLLILGFGLVTNAFFVMISTLASFLISKIFIIDKGEKILEKKYGASYVEYKKSVKF